ncbi:MAG: hypothetical protein D6813_13875, partial [Calditrichaeota bacterium]
GCMFAQKTTRLFFDMLKESQKGLCCFLRVSTNTNYVLGYQPSFRWLKQGEISANSIIFKKVPRTFTFSNIFQYSAIAIDEVQFLYKPDFLMIERFLINRGNVYAAGLDKDFMGQPFESTTLFVSHADEVEKLKAICSKCQQPALHTARLRGDFNTRLEETTDDMWQPLCRSCYKTYREEYLSIKR